MIPEDQDDYLVTLRDPAKWAQISSEMFEPDIDLVESPMFKVLKQVHSEEVESFMKVEEVSLKGNYQRTHDPHEVIKIYHQVML